MGSITAYPIVSTLGFFRVNGAFQTVLSVAALLAVLILVVLEFRDRADEKDATKVLRDGLGSTATELEELLLAAPAARQNKFNQLGKIATNAIAGLADTERTQAQLFWVHEHRDHSHLVSIHASNGNKEKSNNHFSSIGDAVDRKVWHEAINDRTVFYRNLSKWRMNSMPIGYSRRDKLRKYKTFITAPIKVDGNLLGLLTINSETPFSLSLRDKYLVEIFAQQIALGAASSKSLLSPRAYESIKAIARKGCTP